MCLDFLFSLLIYVTCITECKSVRLQDIRHLSGRKYHPNQNFSPWQMSQLKANFLIFFWPHRWDLYVVYFHRWQSWENMALCCPGRGQSRGKIVWVSCPTLAIWLVRGSSLFESLSFPGSQTNPVPTNERGSGTGNTMQALCWIFQSLWDT